MASEPVNLSAKILHLTYQYPVHYLVDVLVKVMQERLNGSVTINFVSGVPGGTVDLKLPINGPMKNKIDILPPDPLQS